MIEASEALNNELLYDDNCFRELEAKLTNTEERQRRLARLKRKELFKETEEKQVEDSNDSIIFDSMKFKRELDEFKNIVSETSDLEFLRSSLLSINETKTDYPSLTSCYRMAVRALKESSLKKGDKEFEDSVAGEKKYVELERNFSEKERENFVLRETVTQRDKKLQESIDRYDKLQFDFDKFRERTSSDATNKASKEFEDIILKILPIIDDFERAFQSAKTSSDNNQPILQGLEMVLTQFYSILKQIGIEILEAKDKLFDPKIHEALMTEVNNDLPEDTVVEVLSNGYTFNSRLLKAAKVKISKHS